MSGPLLYHRLLDPVTGPAGRFPGHPDFHRPPFWPGGFQAPGNGGARKNMDVDFFLHGLLAVGVVVILGLFTGKLFERLRIPKITGYLLIGVLIGPSGLGIVSDEIHKEISVVKDIALGMLLFAIGGVFEFHRLKNVGPGLVRLTLTLAATCFVMVTLGLYLIQGNLYFSSFLGAICITTSPGAALLVTREFNSSGPLTEMLIFVVGISNILSIVTFQLIQSLGSPTFETSVLMSLTWLIAKLVGGVIIGITVGSLLSWWEGRVEDQSELILAFLAGILVITGLAKSLGLNPLLPALVMGIVTTNMSMMHRLIYVEMRQTEQPLYIAFFVLSGASLQVGLLNTMGLAGAGYMLLSAAGKIGSVRLLWRRLRLEEKIGRYLGPSLLAQGGVAIGLANTLAESDPHLAPLVSSIVLTSVIFFEIIGPSTIRWSLIKCGETRV
ncbi:MAG: cation:proton antiporter [Candidatus Zixiibacteriota bacterium]